MSFIWFLIIGAVAGLVIVHGIEFIERTLKIDDPVGAVGVHGICGAFGTMAVGIFAYGDGLIYGGGTALLLTQTIGVLAVAAWTMVTAFILFKTIDLTIGLRVDIKEEHVGLDINEHGIESYADFSLKVQ